MHLRSVFSLVLMFGLTACSPQPEPGDVRLARALVDYYNEILPEALPRFPIGGEGPAIYLAGRLGERSYLIRPGLEVNLEAFPDDTLNVGRSWNYLSFRDTQQVSNNYAASIYSPGDSSRFGPNAEVLEMATTELYKEDNPTDSGLGYLAVFIHELAHTTEHYASPNRIPRMLEQMMVFERNTVLRRELMTENNLLLAALEAATAAERNDLVGQYLTLKDKRTETMLSLDLAAENYYEFNEGYGRYVEHLAQEQFTGERFPHLEEVFGPSLAYDLSERKWMYDLVGMDYFYVLGFNKYRILAAADDWRFAASVRGESDKLLDDYLRDLINEPVQ